MILVNHKVVVTQAQLNMLAMGAEPTPSGEWMYDETLANLTGLPVIMAPQWPAPPVSCGEGWLAIAMDDVVYAWNDAELRENLEAATRESIMNFTADLSREEPSLGLFQQRVGDYYGYVPTVRPTSGSILGLGGSS